MPEKYAALLALLEQRSGAQVDFRLAETPLFMHVEQLEEMASAGAELAEAIIGNPDCLAAARRAIPAGYLVAGKRLTQTFLLRTLRWSATRRPIWFPAWWRSRHFPLYMDTSQFSAPVTATSLD